MVEVDKKFGGLVSVILATAAITAAATTILMASFSISDFIKDMWFDWHPPPVENTRVLPVDIKPHRFDS